MLQALKIRHLAPTDTKGTRFKVTACAGSKTYGYDYALNFDDNIRIAAETFAQDMFGLSVLSIGNLHTGDYCATLSTLKTGE